ncbi:hypothetical protein C6P46_003646 [Rhodotorula mucilaginosa]|uniref:Uncharacterized protein n=1 Tax=Rhodotorula mucilaginosa TaxID=5537 RepID=A0A9P6WA28_RHOMI|nr:hypothetical protein C6P46_003646 [Rhodotorula mucilaginosa]
MSPWLPRVARRRRSSVGSTQSRPQTGSWASTGEAANVQSAHDERWLVPPPKPVMERLLAPVNRSDLKALEKVWEELLINKEEATRFNDLYQLAPQLADLCGTSNRTGAELNTLKAEARLADKKVKRLEGILPGLCEEANPYNPVSRNSDSSRGAAGQDGR